MPSPGRKFLMAGRGGLNLTHSEPLERFLPRYGPAARHASTAPSAPFRRRRCRAWADGLGAATFVGSSGRVFPQTLKATPLLRAWLRRLDALGVTVPAAPRWLRLDRRRRARLRDTGRRRLRRAPPRPLLALGGASWPRLGSDGAWVPLLAARGVGISPLAPANCGFEIAWSDIFRERFAGTPLKTDRPHLRGDDRPRRGRRHRATASRAGASTRSRPALRAAVTRGGMAVTLSVDLRPDVSEPDLVRAARDGAQGATPRRTCCARRPGCRRCRSASCARSPAPTLPARAGARSPPSSRPCRSTLSPRVPLDRAISTAGGIAFAALDGRVRAQALPGTFAAGEMLDWEAPTGGYLLQASFATGVAAAKGMLARLQGRFDLAASPP